MAQTIEELKAEGKTPEIIDLFPSQGKWTEKDYYRLPETNRIVELSKGRLIITPSPTDQHQKISSNLYFLVRNYIHIEKPGEVRYSPLDVRLGPCIIRQPDIVFMSNKHRNRITKKRWGVPDLAMEILSEGTKEQDLGDKFREYEKAGIPEYWIVNPFNQTIEVFTLENRVYVLSGKWGAGEIAHSKVLTGFQAAVDSVFE